MLAVQESDAAGDLDTREDPMQEARPHVMMN
jgi:hypothetical protein